jgi:hypothetical protein
VKVSVRIVGVEVKQKRLGGARREHDIGFHTSAAKTGDANNANNDEDADNDDNDNVQCG